MKDSDFVNESLQVVDNILEIIEMEVEELTAKEKELIAAYSFGIVLKSAQEKKVSKDLQNISIIKMLTEKLEYTDVEAEQLVKILYSSTEESGDSGLYIMIHQGGAIYKAYISENINEVYDNLTNMMDVVIRKEYEAY